MFKMVAAITGSRDISRLTHMNSDISFPSHRENRFYQGMAATFVANALQAFNFCLLYTSDAADE